VTNVSRSVTNTESGELTNSCSARQTIHKMLRKQIYSHIQNSSSLASVLSQMNPVTSYSFTWKVVK